MFDSNKPSTQSRLTRCPPAPATPRTGRARLRHRFGVRREDVAQLAAISTGYYTLLEQGRIRPWAPVLVSLARVLRLDDDQRTYMYELAGTPAATKSRRRPPHTVKAFLPRALDRIDAPAIVMTPTHDILTWNRLAAALMVDFGEIPERERNFMRLLFTNPRLRSLYPEWEELARAVVSYMRMEAARKPGRPAPRRARRRPLDQGEQFRQWWAGTHVAVKRRGTRRYNPPVVVGDVSSSGTRLPRRGARPTARLYTAEPRSRSEQPLRHLAAGPPRTSTDPADRRRDLKPP
jgi:transcriptional regulator with XRE-family HTH domain